MNLSKIKSFGFKANALATVINNLFLLLLEVIVNQFFFVAFITFIIAEIFRVYNGIATYETHTSLIWLVSFILVVLVAIMRYQLETYLFNGMFNVPKNRNKFSIRILWRDVVYFLGLGKKWTAIPKADEEYILMENLIKFIKTVIVLASTFGSVFPQLKDIEGVWYKSFYLVINTFTIADIIPLVISFLVSVALIQASDFLAKYIAKQNQQNKRDLQSSYDELTKLSKQNTIESFEMQSITSEVPKSLKKIDEGFVKKFKNYTCYKNAQRNVYIMESVDDLGITSKTEYNTLYQLFVTMKSLSNDLRKWKTQ